MQRSDAAGRGIRRHDSQSLGIRDEVHGLGKSDAIPEEFIVGWPRDAQSERLPNKDQAASVGTKLREEELQRAGPAAGPLREIYVVRRDLQREA